MSLQIILNSANSLQINRRRLIGVQYTRNQLPRTSQTPTYNPWRFTVTLPNLFQYSQVRTLLEEIDLLDRNTPQEFTLSESGKLDWMFAYQGTLSLAQRNQITYYAFNENQLQLNVSSVTGATSGDYVVRKGDFIQVENKPYPFTSLTDVFKGSGSTVTITTHRPNIFSTQPSAGDSIYFGNAVTWNMFCPNMPTYKLTPGGAIISGNDVVNNALIEWSDPFQLYEWTAGA
jgi:hypothetical protein